METQWFDQIARRFADRKRSRRHALAHGTASLAANARTAEEATAAAFAGVRKEEYLFVQSFQSGHISAKDGADGTYTLTLEHDLGQTIYFSDRPERVVGAGPTARFLESFPFPPSNPPNAALVIDATGGAKVAVVELTNPRYDTASQTATYDATLLKERDELGISVAGANAGGELPDRFGTSHLFIDDCPDLSGDCTYCDPGPFGGCHGPVGTVPGPDLPGNTWPLCYQFPCCVPCAASRSWEHLASLCNEQIPACQGNCTMNPGSSCIV